MNNPTRRRFWQHLGQRRITELSTSITNQFGWRACHNLIGHIVNYSIDIFITKWRSWIFLCPGTTPFLFLSTGRVHLDLVNIAWWAVVSGVVITVWAGCGILQLPASQWLAGRSASIRALGVGGSHPGWWWWWGWMIGRGWLAHRPACEGLAQQLQQWWRSTKVRCLHLLRFLLPSSDVL